MNQKLIAATLSLLMTSIAMAGKEYTSLGYIRSDARRAKKLIEMKKFVPSSAMQVKNDPYFYWLRQHASDMTLTFSFNGATDPTHRYGFAPAGTTVKSSWTRIAEFFEHDEFGTCSLTLLHIQPVKMGIKIRKDDVSYQVNGQPTVTLVEGNKEYGFLYAITWVTPTFSKTLECAKVAFDKEQMQKMIIYANTIEKRTDNLG